MAARAHVCLSTAQHTADGQQSGSIHRLALTLLPIFLLLGFVPGRFDYTFTPMPKSENLHLFSSQLSLGKHPAVLPVTFPRWVDSEAALWAV